MSALAKVFSEYFNHKLAGLHNIYLQEKENCFNRTIVLYIFQCGIYLLPKPLKLSYTP